MSNIIQMVPNALPQRDQLQTFFYVLFGYSEGLIPCRSFPESGTDNSQRPHNIWIDADELVMDKAVTFAKWTAREKVAFYVIPGIVSKQGQAGSDDIQQMQVLLIDIDSGDTEEKLKTLTSAIGQPTMIVESGGITPEGSAKLHIYWQLERPAAGDDLQRLIKLRYRIALAAGGDTHFKSAHQPIRVAGSIYHKKGACKLVKIRSYEPLEYNLEELIKSAEKLPKCKEEDSSNPLDYNNTTPVFKDLLISKVYEGGESEQSRFSHLQRVTGFWLRRLHEGAITQQQAWEEITGYNAANVVPAWDEKKLRQLVDGLWRKHVKKHGEAAESGEYPDKPEQKTQESTPVKPAKVASYSLGTFLNDTSSLPEDIIAPRILTPSGMFVFGGAPKVGKSDFLLSLFTHMAAGKEFIGFKPPRPLKIFYFQAEIGYHYLRERLQNMQLSDEIIKLAQDNLHITPNTKLLLNEPGIEAVAAQVKSVFQDETDIIAIDPIRNVFDGGRDGATENENDAMLFFLQKRIEPLRDMINPNAGIILAHHTKKLSHKQFDEEPFAAFSGASSLRGYYSSGAILRKSELDDNERELIFELRNGAHIPTKILNKKDGAWVEEDSLNKRIAYKTNGTTYDMERERRIMLITKLLQSQASKGKFYLMNQFAQKYQNHKDLGGRRSIYDDCSIAATKGDIKFFNNPKDYNPKISNPEKGFGFMCTEHMKIHISKTVDSDTGEIVENNEIILPTHYKNEGDGRKAEMKYPEIWDVDSEENNTINEVENAGSN
ncbi:MAG: hypothetical protein COA94_01080 [Rickettsiales bacterium]|nr:MAG: hypothetical protein COA94_01080 [Rickettsiales bacterium]